MGIYEFAMHNCDADMLEQFAKLVDRLDPPVAT